MGKKTIQTPTIEELEDLLSQIKSKLQWLGDYL
jgi:hypothetical protein